MIRCIYMFETYLFPLFKNSSKNLTNIDTVTMDFGDGNKSKQIKKVRSIKHRFGAVGSYKVYLRLYG